MVYDVKHFTLYIKIVFRKPEGKRQGNEFLGFRISRPAETLLASSMEVVFPSGDIPALVV
jgi:hypothetical protein